jgi:hypothetical protein
MQPLHSPPPLWIQHLLPQLFNYLLVNSISEALRLLNPKPPLCGQRQSLTSTHIAVALLLTAVVSAPPLTTYPGHSPAAHSSRLL